MSNIDAIIARSRQAGEFSERKSFQVSRERAIRKMREFALADPHYYVLELIQAAIASGATHVDMQIDDDTFILSYVGGGFSEGELTALFDFLFAAKSDVSTGAIRQLALGVNALMRFEPDQIILESGDGTLAGTTRVEINPGRDLVEVGTPEAALNGSFLRAQGLRRRKVRGQSSLIETPYGPRECSAIEERCLAAPVPILVNSHPVFGYTSIRSPRLIGYDDVIKFDEGELYGSIGVARQVHNQVFKLLTWGVWVESVHFPLVEGKAYGGIVTYNHLNKTADHSAIVQDKRLSDLWAQLRTYAHMAASDGARGEGFRLKFLGGDTLEPRHIRLVLDAHSCLLVVEPSVEADTLAGLRALRIGQALSAPVFSASAADGQILEDLAGPNIRVIRFEDLKESDEAIFNQALVTPPERPWLLGVREMPAMRAGVLAAQLKEAAFAAQLQRAEGEQDGEDAPGQGRLLERLGGARSQYNVRIYTPMRLPRAARSGGADGSALGVWVRVVALERVVWEGAVESPYAGHFIEIDAPVDLPSDLLAANPFDPSQVLAESIARAIVAGAQKSLEETSAQALEQLSHAPTLPNTAGAYIALAALLRDSTMQIRAGQNAQGAAIRFDLRGASKQHNLGELELFSTLDGRTINLRELESIMAHTGGLVYGTVPEVPANLDGLDQSRILALDPRSEALLVELVGHGAYIRVDARERLARSSDRRWEVRDLAFGLRAYPNAPLLVEPAPGSSGEASGAALPDEAVIKELVQALYRTLVDGLGDPRREEAEEARRQAARHLRHFVCWRRLYQPHAPTYGVEQLGLFWDEQFREVSLAQILGGFQRFGRIVMLDGRASENPQAPGSTDPEHMPRALMLNPWSFRLLQPLGTLVGAFEAGEEGAQSGPIPLDWRDRDAMVAVRQLDAHRYKGWIGLPTAPVEAPFIRVISADRRRVSLLRQSSIEFGLVGVVELNYSSDDWEATLKKLDAKLRAESTVLLGDMLDKLAQLEESGKLLAALQVLLGFGARHLQFSASTAGPVRPVFVGAPREQDLARRILQAPVFATRQRLPVGALSFLRQAAREHCRGEQLAPASRLELREDVPEVLAAWLERLVRRVHATPRRPPPSATAAAPQTPPPAPADSSQLAAAPLARRLELLLSKFRPDTLAESLAQAQLGEQAHPDQVAARQTRILIFDFAGPAPPSSVLPPGISSRIYLRQNDEAFLYINYTTPYLLINQKSPLVQRALGAAPGDDAPLAWLLLAAYAHINYILTPVTNEHELRFQRRVLDALRAGELR